MKIVIKKDIEENGYITGSSVTDARIWLNDNNINYMVVGFSDIIEKLTINDFKFLEDGNTIFWDDYTIKGIMQPPT